MITLADFLLARIDDVESLANGGQSDMIPYDCWSPDEIRQQTKIDRLIISLHNRPNHQCVAQDGPTQWHANDPCATFKLMALKYQWHKDFREEWKV